MSAIAPVRTNPLTDRLYQEIVIPESQQDLRQVTEGLAALAFVTEWARAAIVYAWTEDQQGRRNDQLQPEVAEVLGIYEFARLNLPGLGSHSTVRAYREAWKWAMAEHGAPEAIKGQPISVPPVSWAEYRKQLATKMAIGQFTDRAPDAYERIASRNPKDANEAIEIGETLFPKPQEANAVAKDKIILAVNDLNRAVHENWHLPMLPTWREEILYQIKSQMERLVQFMESELEAK